MLPYWQEIIYKNEFISLINNDGSRLDLLDSDGEFIDYFNYLEDMEEPEKEIEHYQNLVKDLDESEVCNLIYNMFDVVKIVPQCTKEKIAELRKQWGQEYVNRVGSTAIIIKE